MIGNPMTNTHHFFRHLILHSGSRGSGAFTIYKRKSAIILNLFHNIHRIRKIFFCLSRESHNNICRKGNVRIFGPDLIYQFQIAFLGIMTIHDL